MSRSTGRAPSAELGLWVRPLEGDPHDLVARGGSRSPAAETRNALATDGRRLPRPEGSGQSASDAGTEGTWDFPEGPAEAFPNHSRTGPDGPSTAGANRPEIRQVSAHPRSEDAVPTAARRWKESVERYGEERRAEQITPRHAGESCRVALEVGRLLREAGLACHPRDFGEPQLRFLLRSSWTTRKQDGRDREGQNGSAYNWWALGHFLKRFDNLTVERARLRWDRTPVRRKQRLSFAERVQLLDTARQLGIVPYGMVVLMLTMGLRPSEVRRLTASQASADPMVFRGKGKGIAQGLGKIRRVPHHPLWTELLPELLAHRALMTGDASADDSLPVFCHVWNGRVAPWSKAWVDRRFILPVFERAGVKQPWNLSYVLRRTFGRVARLESRNDLERVARLMGHEDTRTTTRYLGLDDDDDRSVMESMRDAFGPRPVAATESQEKGGRIGHVA